MFFFIEFGGVSGTMVRFSSAYYDWSFGQRCSGGPIGFNSFFSISSGMCYIAGFWVGTAL